MSASIDNSFEDKLDQILVKTMEDLRKKLISFMKKYKKHLLKESGKKRKDKNQEVSDD